ncbi:MAG TPA: BTAD domain-containing putative transcriptional regulator, partial [Streptosporangiaceae bacterium]
MRQPPYGVGDLLRRYRVGAEVTQQELARRAGLSVRALRDIEHNRVPHPHPRSVHRLATALGLGEAERAGLLATAAGATTHSALQVDVLGPLAVRSGDEPVNVGPQKQRGLLGVLALQPRRVVPVEEIVDTLWGDGVPRTCLGLVHTYVARLRTSVEPERARHTPARVLARVHGGYRLDLADDQSDLARFFGLAARGLRARADGDLDAASALLGQALRCWRGPAAVDLGVRLRQHPAAVAANQRRMLVALAFADVAIDCGRHAQAVACLQALVGDEGLHEGLHARLMLALAGDGQQAAALRLFADVRARLADELGVEPGGELREAHLRVLRQEVPAPDAVLTARGAPAAAGARPAQLPADVAAFAGRTGHLQQLDALLASARPESAHAVVISAIAGTAGVGKTALAVHWGHRARDRFPDGQLYVNLRGFDPSQSVMEPAEAVRGFLDALLVAPQRIPLGLDAQIALYRSLLAGRRMLVVLDNARDCEQVRPLLPGGAGCLAVVTSRNQLTGLVVAEGAHLLVADLLTFDEARDLLARRLGPDRVNAEPEAVHEIITRCARLPLALAVVAARAGAHPRFPLASLAADLRPSRGGLDALDGADPATNVRTVFSWSYEVLTP